jgi:hypothetical protein
MSLPKGQGRPGRGCCGICFGPFGCGDRHCGCHESVGAVCRRPGCGAGLFVALPIDSDRAIVEAQKRLLADYGYERGAA